jgi:hypothetical protein
MDELFDKEFDIKKLRMGKGIPKKEPLPKGDSVSKHPHGDYLDEMSLSVEKGIEEIKKIHGAYIAFIDNIKDLALYLHVREVIFDLGIALDTMQDIVQGDVEKQIQRTNDPYLVEKVRETVMRDLYNKYKDEEE